MPALLELAGSHRIAGVLTNPESGQGRGREVQATPVARAAALLPGGPVPVLSPERLGADARAAVSALGADLLVSFAYGRIFGPRFLALFPKGGINVHPSLLPRHRGPTPIPAAILARDAETGVSIQRLALEMDAGDLLAVERIALTGRETTGSLSALCAQIGARLVARVVARIEAGTDRAVPQEGEPDYCPLIAKTDGLLDWDSSCLDLDARIRAYNPWPAAYTSLRGQRLNILESVPWPDAAAQNQSAGAPGAAAQPAAAQNQPAGAPGAAAQPAAAQDQAVAPDRHRWPVPGTVIGLDKSSGVMVQTRDGLLALTRLQFSTRKALSYKEFANGVRDLPGLVLGQGL